MASDLETKVDGIQVYAPATDVPNGRRKEVVVVGSGGSASFPSSLGAKTSAGSLSTVPATDAVYVLASGAAAGVLNSTSTAREASRVIKASAGTLFGLTVTNTGVAGFLQFHDRATVGSDGITPLFSVAMPVTDTAPVLLDWGTLGRPFSTGIVVVFSSTRDTQTTGAATCWFDGQYK